MTSTAGLRVLAADLEPYTLSPQQALALYGLSIPVDLYTGSSTVTYNAEYIGNTLDVQAGTQVGTYGDSTYVSNFSIVDTQYNWLDINRVRSTPYLIYRFQPPNIPSAANFSFSIRLAQSLGITAYGIGTSVMWSYYRGAGMTADGADNPSTSSSYTLYGDSLNDVLTVGTSFRRRNLTRYYGQISTQLLPVKITDDPSGYMQPYEYICSQDACISMLGAVAFAGSTVSGGDSVTVGESIAYIKQESKLTPYDTFHYSTNSYSNSKVTASEDPDNCVYIMVQCPTLYGEYVLPDDGGEENIDLTQIEEYLAQQGEDIANISEESTVQTRQLIAILAKLEQIYQAIQASGFNPSLNPQTAQTLPALNWSEQQSAIASGTLSAQDVQDMTPAAGMLTDSLGDILDASGLTLFAVGLVSLCAAGWFLTQGRG